MMYAMFGFNFVCFVYLLSHIYILVVPGTTQSNECVGKSSFSLPFSLILFLLTLLLLLL